MAFVKALFQPPARLRALPDQWARVLRPLWVMAILASLAVVALGSVQALRETYEIKPGFAALGLDYDVEDNGQIRIKLVKDRPKGISSDTPLQITAINGAPVPADILTNNLGRRLAGAAGPSVALDARTDDGRPLKLQRTRDTSVADGSAVRARDLRVAGRMTTGLLACTAFLICSFLLARRRPNASVALLLAFAFAGMAATIDPPLALWMAMGWPLAYDVISSVWFYLLLIALATFPDGIFVPKSYRWLIPVGAPLAVFVSLHDVNSDVQVLVGIGSLLAVLVGLGIRYRRAGSGIERQQLKWAAFGFTSGFLLILLAFVMLMALPSDPTKQNMLLTMAIVLAFSLGMAAIPLGLLVALTRFRLWEADTVITKSAAYAVVTLVVGIVWAASSDLVKLVIVEVIGHESEAGATTVGAVIAAGVFSPTQSLVLDWTKRHFGGPLEQIHDAAKRLKSWGLTEPPAEVATRALAIIDHAVHPIASAIVLDTAIGHDLIAARDVSSADDPRLIEKLTLEDEESSVGTLFLGRRSDGNRYNKQELEAIQEIIPSLAEALRVARGRYSRENMMQQRLDEMAARLAQLEGGAPKPA